MRFWDMVRMGDMVRYRTPPWGGGVSARNKVIKQILSKFSVFKPYVETLIIVTQPESSRHHLPRRWRPGWRRSPQGHRRRRYVCQRCRCSHISGGWLLHARAWSHDYAVLLTLHNRMATILIRFLSSTRGIATVDDLISQSIRPFPWT